MKFLETTKDGGAESTVWAHWLFELKRFLSIALLRFEDGSRDAFHSHAFDCVSVVLRGELVEEHLSGEVRTYGPLRPIVTRRDTFHRVRSSGRTWVLTVRGPWVERWFEWLPRENRFVVLSHGRREVEA